MKEEDDAGGHLDEATAGLEEGLETCHKIISDYRSMLLNIEHPTDCLRSLTARLDRAFRRA